MSGEQKSEKIFTKLAPLYDHLMYFIDYPRWVDYIIRLLKKAGIKGKTLLDLACGTGTCLLLFNQKGFKVIGVDKSADMLACAGEKITKGDGHIELVQQDMRNLTLNTSVDVVTCLYDSLNYLLEKEDLKKTFAAVYKILRYPGAFIFDLNTSYALKNVWGNKIHLRNYQGIFSLWENSYDQQKDLSSLTLTWYTLEGNSWRKQVERHQERTYEERKVKTLLKEAGFHKVEIYDHCTFRKPDKFSSRIMVIAQK